MARDAGSDPQARVQRAFLLACGRVATAAEQAAASEFLAAQPAEYAGQVDADERAWIDFAQMLLATNAFLYCLIKPLSMAAVMLSLNSVKAMLGTVAQQPIEEIIAALVSANANQLLGKIAEIAEFTPNYSEILQQILRIFHRIAVLQQSPTFVDHEFDMEWLASLAKQITQEDVQLFYQIALIGARDLDLAPDPRCGFEMVMLRMLAFKPQNSTQQERRRDDGRGRRDGAGRPGRRGLPPATSAGAECRASGICAVEGSSPAAPAGGKEEARRGLRDLERSLSDPAHRMTSFGAAPVSRSIRHAMRMLSS